MIKIGVLGGTFSPVHNEHVELAKAAIDTLKLDKLLIMPTLMPPHKSGATAPAQDRLNMLEIAFKDVYGAEVSDFEIQKGGKSYTYQTVEHVKRLNPDAEVFFLVGGDMLKDFKTWKNPERILSACTLVAANRTDDDANFDEEKEYFLTRFGKSFICLSFCGKRCSSTKIRTYVKLGLSTEGQCDEKVREYIDCHGLYAGDKYTEFIKRVLPEKRRRHTANVIVSALEKVKETGLDKEKVFLSALLHDCAKYLSPEDFEGFTMPEDLPKPVVHAFLGAFIAEHVLKIKDQEIIDAIRYHTSGKANMSTLGKLIFVADMIEEDRTYPGVDELRDAYKIGLDYCLKKCLEEEIIHLKNKRSPIYVETLNAYDYYVNSNGGEI